MSQLSTVQALPSVQSALLVQQLPRGRFPQVCVPTLHVSTVQVTESPHEASLVQQPGSAECTHVLVVKSQTSALHASASTQSASELQQPAMAAFVHAPLRPQESTVQLFRSSQSEAPVQHEGVASFSQRCVSRSQVLVKQVAPVLHDASSLQQSNTVA